MKLCLKCGTVGNLSDEYGIIPLGEYTSGDVSLCKDSHIDSIIDIDENIAWDIFNLNKAGYKTRFSCAGHPYNKYTSFYVSFDKDYDDIQKYFNEYNPEYLELEKDQYFYYRDDEDKCLGLMNQNDVSVETKDNFVFIDKYAYIIRSKYKGMIDDMYKEIYTSIDDANAMIYHKNILNDLRKLVCELCIKNKGRS